MNRKDLAIGQEVVLIGTVRRGGGRERGTVTKIGRKYVTVKPAEFRLTHDFDIETQRGRVVNGYYDSARFLTLDQDAEEARLDASWEVLHEHRLGKFQYRDPEARVVNAVADFIRAHFA